MRFNNVDMNVIQNAVRRANKLGRLGQRVAYMIYIPADSATGEDSFSLEIDNCESASLDDGE